MKHIYIYIYTFKSQKKFILEDMYIRNDWISQHWQNLAPK